jgi:hypothetical protein
MELTFPEMEKVVYLDVEFISQKYEQVTGISAESVLTRTEGGQAGLRIPFASAGVHTQESRSYPLSSTKMLKKVFDELKNYDWINLNAWENGKGSRVGWINGSLSVGTWIRSVSGEEKERHKYYELYCEKTRLGLLPKISYFYPGFSDLLDLSEALMSNIDIPVMMLARVLYHAEVSSTYACVPLVAFETGTAV